MEPQKPSKRPRQVPCVSSSTGQNHNQNPNPNLNPNSLPNVPGSNENDVDLIALWFLSLLDLPSLSIERSFDRVLEKMFEASGDKSAHLGLTVRTLEVTSLLQDTTKKWLRKYATRFNFNSWPLPEDLTVKVFSMLDTKSLMQASACCTMFYKFALDPLLYSHIELTSGDVHDSVVSRMISRAGKGLRSLKVGRSEHPFEIRASLLTGACFGPLYDNQGFKWDLLRILHIYSSRWLDEKYLFGVFSACPNLIDFKIVGLDACPVDVIVECLPRECQHLFIERENKGYYGQLRFPYVPSLGMKWPNITSLSLIGFMMNDRDACLLIIALCKLKYMDLSRSHEISGSFLRDMRYYCNDNLLETLILRDCASLQKDFVCQFLDSLIKGHSLLVGHIDLSSKRGIISDGLICYNPEFPLEELKDKRPGLTFVADFPLPSSTPPPSPSSSLPSSSSSSSSSSEDTSSGRESEDDDDF